MISDSLPSRMRQIRKIRRYSQRGIAEAMGISQQAYAQMEVKGVNPKIKTLEKYCATVNTSVQFLISPEAITEQSLLQNSAK